MSELLDFSGFNDRLRSYSKQIKTITLENNDLRRKNREMQKEIERYEKLLGEIAKRMGFDGSDCMI